MATACLILASGCQSTPKQPAPRIANYWLGPVTIAVAPAVNLSGSNDFDPARFADLMAGELSYADGVSIIPVSRVMGVLGAQGAEGVESPSHALELTRLLGADAILVFAVIEYDPYDPPSLGISAQLYGTKGRTGGGIDPVALSRQGGLDESDGAERPRRLLSQTQRIYDATHQDIVEEVKTFAALRGADGSPYGWRRYVVSQQDYIRFCCHATIRALFDSPLESGRVGRGRDG